MWKLLPISCVIVGLVACETDSLFELQAPPPVVAPPPTATPSLPTPVPDAPPGAVLSGCLGGYAWVPYELDDDFATGATWASAPNDMWTGLSPGRIAHWNGERFTSHDIGARSTVMTIGGRASDDIWVGLSDGTVLSFDGSSWSPLAELGQARGQVYWGFGKDDLWVQKDDLLQHFDGTSFRSDPTWPDSNGAVMWGPSSDDVYLVRSRYPDHQAQTHHWDGATWTQLAPSSFPVVARALTGTEDGRLWMLSVGMLTGLSYLAPQAPWVDLGVGREGIAVPTTLHGVGNDVLVGGAGGVRLDRVIDDAVCNEMTLGVAGSIGGFWSNATDDVWAIGIQRVGPEETKAVAFHLEPI